MAGIDPITLAILKGRLEQIADEMDATLFRSAFNPIIAEARDACHGRRHRSDASVPVPMSVSGLHRQSAQRNARCQSAYSSAGFVPMVPSGGWSDTVSGFTGAFLAIAPVIGMKNTPMSRLE